MTTEVDLVVTGMTCASCAMRIERKLNKIDGVNAAVNYATGIAHVVYDPSQDVDSLVAAVEAAGYHALPPSPLLDAQVAQLEAEHERDLALRWRVGAAFALPTVAIAMVPPLQFSGWQWATVALAAPVVAWAAWPLHRASFKNARFGTTTMDTLVSMGVIAAFLGSIWQLLMHGTEHSTHIYIDVAVVVPVFVLLGRWLEARNKQRAGAALRALADATPKSAIVRRAGVRSETPLDQVLLEDVVIVTADSTIAVDGIVIEGASSVSNALLTGESLPHPVAFGSEVQAGAVNHEGELAVSVTAVGAGSTIARIASLVAAAQSGKANISRLADRVSAVFVPAVFAITLVTGLAWWFIDSERVMDVMIAILVIACPCALGLATPTALVVGSGRAAQLGVLIAGPEVFETARRVDAIVFDKTGTLTTGEMSVTNHTVPAEYEALVGALAARSSHPVSVATAARFAGSSIELSAVTAVPGLGIKAKWQRSTGDAVDVEFGSHRFHEAELPRGEHTASWLFVAGEPVGFVEVADTIDPTAKSAIAGLHRAGIRTVMASGDKQSVAERIAAELGIDEVHAELKPADKITVIESLQSSGLRVAMVGDGSNDAPALAASDIGIAMGRGTGIARATADITLLRPDLNLVPTSLSLARGTLRVIKQNLGWAFGYNLAALPLAMSGNLNPVIAGIAMSASSVLVVSNSLRLRRVRL